MLRFVPFVLLTACGADLATDPVGPDLDAAAQDVEDALDAADPEPLIALLSMPAVEDLTGCPSIERIENDMGLREVWTGGCVQSDGTFIDGHLERFEGPTGVWVSGEAFGIYRDGLLDQFIDGAIEMSGEGGLWLVDATVTTCSAEGWRCSDGTVSVDLAFTVFPTENYPSDYDVTVSGVVATDASPIVVDGAWSVDVAACGVEPTEGVVVIQRGVHQTLRMDGAATCDACAKWVLQGRDAPPYCATSF